MKIFHKGLLLLLTVCAGFISCTDSKDKEEKTYNILFTENPFMVGSNEGSHSTVFVSEHQWTAAAADSWISDVSINGNEVSFTVEKNPEEVSRDGKIRFTVSGDDYTKDLTIRQAANTGNLKAEKTSVTMTTLGEEISIQVTAAENWNVTDVTGSWLSAVRKNSTTLTLSAAPNYTGSRLSSEVKVETASKKENLTITVTQEADNAVFCGATSEAGRRFVHKSSGLVSQVTNDNSYSLGDHVDALEIQYMGKVGNSVNPYSVFVFEVDLTGDVSILASCVNDDPASIKTVETEWTEVATIREQLYAMQTKRPGLEVLCGVNGDFCYGDASYQRKNLLHGVMYKDGACLKDTFTGGAACTVFAIMKDGKAKILTQSQYASQKGNIAEAVGGRQHLLSVGQKVAVSDTSLEPRTAVGVTSDGKKVILLIVDGRRSSYSVGASYAILQNILLAFGAYDGINLDGGGSSTFLVANPSADKGFETRNKPTDNTGDRTVPNGIAVVRKK